VLDLSSICVFCGSNAGANPAYLEAAEVVGRDLAQRGVRVVYGGATVGMMGALADAVRGEGGDVVGVIPQAIFDREIGHTGLDDLRVVGSMHERKALMAELSDAFIALPGGIGTLEELFEVWTASSLGMHPKPVAVLDPDGFYEPLWRYLDDLCARGFVRPAALGVLHRTSTVDEAFAVFAGVGDHLQ
jgi:uncharacterized protein (TIGR00730 family)